jgi:hypothetical protein
MTFTVFKHIVTRCQKARLAEPKEMSIAAGKCLASRSAIIRFSFGSYTSALRRHVTFLPPQTCLSRVAYRGPAISSACEVYDRPREGSDVILILMLLSPKHRLTFNQLHCAISQQIELFITTTVRASNPTQTSIL